MSVTSTGRIVLLSLLLVAVCGAALAFGIAQLRRPQLLEATAAPSTLATLPPAPGASESGANAESAKSEGTAALAPLQAEANAVATELAALPPVNNHSLPAFDVARIEQSGDAVIAGTAAPGAVVELLRNGERHDQVVADQSGHFVMVPRQLPPGDYELTLRSRLPDGTVGASKQSVSVALHEAAPSPGPGPLQSRAEVSANGPGAAAAKRVRQDVAAAQPEATAAISAPARGSSPAVAEPKSATTVVSRGDSLWRISRLTYGDGSRYALVWRANRDRIRYPDRIYPGQTFILPMNAR